jgi:hypothetical protein
LPDRQQLESQPLGLDELMIVNPGSAPVRLVQLQSMSTPAGERNRPPLFLGDDGIVYALYGAEEPVRLGDLKLGPHGAFERRDGAA